MILFLVLIFAPVFTKYCIYVKVLSNEIPRYFGVRLCSSRIPSKYIQCCLLVSLLKRNIHFYLLWRFQIGWYSPIICRFLVWTCQSGSNGFRRYLPANTNFTECVSDVSSMYVKCKVASTDLQNLSVSVQL